VPVAVAKGKITLYALSKTDGSIKWTFNSTISTAYSTDGNTVYCMTPDDRLVALSAADGSHMWDVKVPIPPDAQGTIPVMACTSDSVVMATTQGTAAALDAKTGSVRWNKPWMEGAFGDQLCPMVAVGPTAFFAAPDGDLIAISASTGDVLWKHPLPGADQLGAQVLLFVTSKDQILASRGTTMSLVDPLTGRSTSSGANPSFPSFPADMVVGGQYWLQWDGNGFTASGDATTLKQSSLQIGEINSELRPAISDGIAYFSVQGNNQVEAMKLSNGAVLGTLAEDAQFGQSIAASTELIVLALPTGKVVALPALK